MKIGYEKNFQFPLITWAENGFSKLLTRELKIYLQALTLHRVLLSIHFGLMHFC